jgi:site-specific DNA-methyltransferase (cytosine-N4-specific)
MIIKGDSRHLPLEDNSVNCIITSPPYWSLRKYDIPDLIWDGDEECEHRWGDILPDAHVRGLHKGGNQLGFLKEGIQETQNKTSGQFCLHCSAWRGQLGLEPTIDLYLKHLLQIMDECKRVLRDDGTMWVNLGDSYGSGSGGYYPHEGELGASKAYIKTKGVGMPKCLMLIPERFAIEMVNSNWELRNDLTEEQKKYVLTELINRGII